MFVIRAEIISYDTEKVIKTHFVDSNDICDFQDWVFRTYGGDKVYIATKIENLWRNRKNKEKRG